MISIKDYANSNGVTYEAVRQQVKRYENELHGHIHRQGRTQFLDDVAVAILNDHRASNPVVVYNKESADRMIELQEQVNQLLMKTAAQADRIAELASWKAENALLIAGSEQTRLALQVAQEEKTALQHDYDQALREMEDLRQEVARHQEQAADAAAREQEAHQEADRLRDELAAYKALPWYKKIFK